VEESVRLLLKKQHPVKRQPHSATILKRWRGEESPSVLRRRGCQDPTNQITAGFDLIRVAIARHPGQIIPLSGSWFGDADDFLSMDVKVTIRKLGTLPDFDPRE
jgi:hypothetical protein